ncbi:MAG: hypothetical protein QGG71_00325 [Pirellulaceae bacterium]|nr:hypothetical protein [Planctomycetaceae bacterium]MDP6553076.1 hypothetical protein [Pirellulaceae bacterium]
MKHTLLAIAGLLAVLSIDQMSLATDHFLTIGGGYSPTGNQISLEKNVQLYQKMLDETYPDKVAHDIYFSDGDDAGRDLQHHDPTVEIPRAQLLLARIFQQTKYQDLQYRSHEITGVRGGASKDNIEKWFSDVGAKLTAGDRLFIYITAHGGRASDKKTPHNTGLFLWNSERCQMSEFTKFLDRIPDDVPVVAVMVQCFSGGFADMVFNEGDAKKGLSTAPRCGFFATVHDRVAAGCTADINEEDYHEYSSYFWAAIRGRTRTDKPIESPDYDKDGVVSLAEAHAYVLLTSTTIDIPTKTSDAFLRQYSKLPPKPASKASPNKNKKEKSGSPNKSSDKGERPEAEAASSEQARDELPETDERPAAELLSADSNYTLLLKLATSADSAVLEGLSAQLELAGARRAQAVRDLAKQIQDEKKKLDGQHRKQSSELKKIAGEIGRSVKNRWPEFANRWHPKVNEFLEKDGVKLVKQIESHPKYARFEELRTQIQQLSDQRFDLDRRWVKCQRLLRSLEYVALAENLSEVASPEVQQRYQQLVEAESCTLN